MSDETYAGEVVFDEQSISAGAAGRVGKIITRYWSAAVVIALALLLWAPRLSGPIDLRWDAGVYYLLGTSLATGHGYRILSEPGSPEALQYPPLLPAVVALHELALGTTNPGVVGPWLRKLYFVIFVAYAVAVLRLARKYLRPWFALAAVTLCLLQIMTIFLSDLLFTELPFALISVVFVLVAASGLPGSRRWLREASLFALAAAGFLLRTAGVALFAAGVIEALIRRRWRLALVRGALALVPIALWQAHVERVRASDEYVHPAYEYQRAPYQTYNVSYGENILLLDPFQPERGLADRRALVTRLVTNFTKMPVAFGETVSTDYLHWRNFLQKGQHLFGRAATPTGIVWVPIFGLSALIVVGLVFLIRRGAWLMVLIVFGSLSLISMTPWPDQFERYLMPVTPFLAIAALLALSQLHTALQTSRIRSAIRIAGQFVVPGFLLFLLVLQAYAAWELFYHQRERGVSQRLFYQSRAWRSWEEAVAWIGARTPPDAIIATTPRHLCYLLANRRAVLPPMESDPARARRLLEAVPVSYVIVDETGEMASFARCYALPAVQSDPIHWHLAHSIYGTRVYERNNGPD